MAPPALSGAGVAARLVIRRFLTTGAEAAEAVAPHAAKAKPAAKGKKDKRPLARRLSALGDAAGEGSVSRVLNEWVREGREARAAAKCARDLRKDKRHAHALEVE